MMYAGGEKMSKPRKSKNCRKNKIRSGIHTHSVFYLLFDLIFIFFTFVSSANRILVGGAVNLKMHNQRSV